MNATVDPTIAGRYLADQLPEPERADYEALLMQSPEAVAELEATARVKIGLARLRASGELDRLLQERPRARVPFLLPLAAGLAAVAIGVGLWRLTPPASSGHPLLAAAASGLVDAGGRAVPIRITVAVFRKRAAAYDAVVHIPAPPAGVELRVLPVTTPRAPSYQVELSRIRADKTLESVATIGELSPADDGFIAVYADASALAPGHYKLTVIPAGAAADGATPGAESYLIDMLANAEN